LTIFNVFHFAGPILLWLYSMVTWFI